MALIIDEKTILGKGATATIYKATDDGVKVAAKLYHENVKINKAKINAMLSNVPVHIKIDSDGNEIPMLAWPTSILEDGDGVAIGYLMPLVDLNNSFPLDYYYDKILFKKLKAPDEAALSFKLEVAKNLASVVSDLHKNGHYFIDLKPQNIRVFRKSHDVTLLDCDGFSIKSKNGVRYPAELISTDYISPEVTRDNTPPRDLGENQDRYALAVILFQLLNNGTHPFQGILVSDNENAHTNDEKAAAGLYPHGIVEDQEIKPRAHSIHHLWPDTTRALFDRAFTGSPKNRPSAEEWADHFGKILSKRELVRCDKHPNEITHMRFKGKPCPACYLEKIPKITNTQSKKNPRVSSNQTNPNGDWQAAWWIIGIIVVLGLMVKCSATSNTSTAYEPAPPAPSAPTADNSYTPPTFHMLENSEPSSPTGPISPTPAPQSYGSMYLDATTSPMAWGWALGYQSQKDADKAAKEVCKSRGGTSQCIKRINGPYKCIAIAESPEWTSWNMGDDLDQLKKEVMDSCSQHSAFCEFKTDSTACSSW